LFAYQNRPVTENQNKYAKNKQKNKRNILQ